MPTGASNHFQTPIFTHDVLGFAEQNEKLAKLAGRLREADPVGVARSNTKGWHSGDDVDLRDLPELVDLKKVIFDAVLLVLDGMGFDGLKLVLGAAWFIVSPAGASNVRHNHPRSFLSGVYYVRAPEGSSPIMFYDPRPAKAYGTPSSRSFRLTPYTADSVTMPVAESRLLIFPGWLDHSVPENKADGERISLSFNLFVA